MTKLYDKDSFLKEAEILGQGHLPEVRSKIYSRLGGIAQEVDYLAWVHKPSGMVCIIHRDINAGLWKGGVIQPAGKQRLRHFNSLEIPGLLYSAIKNRLPANPLIDTFQFNDSNGAKPVHPYSWRHEKYFNVEQAISHCHSMAVETYRRISREETKMKGNNNFHIDSKGNEIAICSLDDQHLINIIKMFCKQIIESTNYLEGKRTTNTVLNAIYDVNARDMETDHKRRIKNCTEQMQKYVLEAAIRGLLGLEVTQLMQQAFQRSEKIPAPSGVLQLEASEDVTEVVVEAV